ncbi:chloramphenicol phosphotransferase CPT family protein [Erythrobacter sp. MTPC3]|uniref:chloramphenicol phosphotransferase CPT family protein n=1 Tax=Erythrobacter sp. MTPC3 TaxID=3056564 RepID=UPI0036F19A4F
MTAQTIILNGVSSAGKSTIARAIQAKAERPFLHVAMDDFISMVPSGKEFTSDWFPVQHMKVAGIELPNIGTGPKGARLLTAMRTCVSGLADSGLDLVVDEVCEESQIADYRSRLSKSRTLFVKVGAPIRIIESREKLRGDRLIGLARAQSIKLHQNIEYDMEVDTSTDEAEDIAARILGECGMRS